MFFLICEVSWFICCICSLFEFGGGFSYTVCLMFGPKSIFLQIPFRCSIYRFLVIMQLGLSIGKSQEKELQPNMKEITSAEDLVDSLLKAGDQLVVVDVKAARLFILRYISIL